MYKNAFLIPLACLASLLPFAPCLALNVSQERMKDQIDIIQAAFENRYAPAIWKSKHHNWSIDKAAEVAKSKIDANDSITVKQFQRIAKEFVHSTHDYHVDIFFFSTESSSLPFRVKPANGKFFISYINRKKLDYVSFPFNIGDEVITFNGDPIAQVVAEIQATEITSSNPATDLLNASDVLTQRVGMLGHAIPKGYVNIEIIPQGSNTPQIHTLKWTHKKELITSPRSLACKEPSEQKRQITNPVKKSLQCKMMLPKAECLGENSHGSDDPNMLGGRISYVPDLGKKLWESSASTLFYAYQFELPGNRSGGYIRIPDYIGTEKHVEQFGKLMNFFERNTDILVIDQVNNPGGSPLYLYSLCSMLTNKSLNVPKHRLALSYEEAALAALIIPLLESIENDADAKMFLDGSLDGYQATLEFITGIKDYQQFILDNWNNGVYFTEPTYIHGISRIKPNHKYRYTKPLIVLTNNQDYSGADFFPCILQDNKRATIFGSRTAGAGGMFTPLEHSNVFGIRQYNATISIAERKNAQPLEDLGVTPDVPYELTERDLQSNYKDFKAALLDCIDNML